MALARVRHRRSHRTRVRSHLPVPPCHLRCSHWNRHPDIPHPVLRFHRQDGTVPPRRRHRHQLVLRQSHRRHGHALLGHGRLLRRTHHHIRRQPNPLSLWPALRLEDRRRHRCHPLQKQHRLLFLLPHRYRPRHRTRWFCTGYQLHGKSPQGSQEQDGRCPHGLMA